MEEHKDFSEEILLSYLDGNLDQKESEAIEKAVLQNAFLKKKLEDLRSADQLLREVKLSHPSKNFTATVLQRLDEYPIRNSLSIKNGILLLAGILVIVSTAIGLLYLGVFDQATTTVNPNEIGFVQKYIPRDLPSFPVDGKLMVNVIVILNLAVMFIVLDRAVLKPYFQKRIHTGH